MYYITEFIDTITKAGGIMFFGLNRRDILIALSDAIELALLFFLIYLGSFYLLKFVLFY